MSLYTFAVAVSNASVFLCEREVKLQMRSETTMPQEKVQQLTSPFPSPPDGSPLLEKPTFSLCLP